MVLTKTSDKSHVRLALDIIGKLVKHDGELHFCTSLDSKRDEGGTWWSIIRLGPAPKMLEVAGRPVYGTWGQLKKLVADGWRVNPH